MRAAPSAWSAWSAWPILALAIATPLAGSDYLLGAILIPFLALALAALGLNLLTGYAGQVSLAGGALMAIGAYAGYNLSVRAPGLPLLADLGLAGLIASLSGLVCGLPSLRLGGFSLAIGTLAPQFVVQWLLTHAGWLSDDDASGVLAPPTMRILGIGIDSAARRYWLCLAVVATLTLVAARLVSGRTGRNLIALRDNETAARMLGVPVPRTKLFVFAVSGFYLGVAGMLWSFAYLRTIEPGGFDLDLSFQILFLIIIGGLGSIRGAFLGAGLIVVLPLVLSRGGALLLGPGFDTGLVDLVQKLVLGVLIIAFLRLEPTGLSALLARCRRRLARRHPDPIPS